MSLKLQPISYEAPVLHKLLNEVTFIKIRPVTAELFSVLCLVPFLYSISFHCAGEAGPVEHSSAEAKSLKLRAKGLSSCHPRGQQPSQPDKGQGAK